MDKNNDYEFSTELTMDAISLPKETFWENIIEDRFSLGFFAGLMAFVVPVIWNHISKFLLGFSALTYTDFASVLIYGRFGQNIYEYLFAMLGVIFWHGLLGIVFAYLLLLIKSRNLLFKGWVFGVMVWFTSYVVTYLYQVPELMEISLNTALSNFIGATFHGITLGYAVGYLYGLKKETR